MVNLPTSYMTRVHYDLHVCAFPLRLHAGVTCLDVFDLNADGTRNLITGRSDGNVEVYYFNDEDKPVRRYSYVSPNLTTGVHKLNCQ